MKRDRNFYYLLLIILFVITYVLSFILSARTVEFGIVIATAGVVIYPLTYFIATFFSERYGREKLYGLLDYSIFALIFAGILITIASLLPVYGGRDGLSAIFNVDFRILFASLLSFYLGQYLNIKIYEFLDYKKWFNFLISATISITVDALIFVLLGYLGSTAFKDVIILFAGQYVIYVGLTIVYAIIFYNLVDSIKKVPLEEEKEIITEKIFDEEYDAELKNSNIKKATSTKKTTTTKKTTSTAAKKASTTKKTTSTTKKPSTKSTAKKTTTKKA